MCFLLNLWGYCSCLNLIIYIIYEGEYRKLVVERFKKRDFVYNVSEGVFFFWAVLISFLVGILGSVSTIIQIILHRSPFPLNTDNKSS